MFKRIRRKLPDARFFYVVAFLCFFGFKAHAQTSYARNEVSVHINRALLGSGDHRAFLYQTRYSRHLNKFLAVSADAGFLTSAHNWNSPYSTKAHINSYYMLNLTGSLAPIILQKHILRLGGGGSYAYRTEVNPVSGTYSTNDTQRSHYVSEDKNDMAGGGFGRQHVVGWHIQLGYSYLVTKNLAAGISLQLISYPTDGDIINAIGFHGGYRF